MQIALEPEMRRQLRVEAAHADSSIKDWLLDNLARHERSEGLESFITSSFGRLLILAPPTHTDRFNLRVDDPKISLALDRVSDASQRTRPQVVYTLLHCLLNEAGESARGADDDQAQSSHFLKIA